MTETDSLVHRINESWNTSINQARVGTGGNEKPFEPGLHNLYNDHTVKKIPKEIIHKSPFVGAQSDDFISEQS
jgi:hypothetical protein